MARGGEIWAICPDLSSPGHIESLEDAVVWDTISNDDDVCIVEAAFLKGEGGNEGVAS